MPVTMCESGKMVKVLRIMGTDEARQHLAEMGFHAGSVIVVISNNGGNLILSVKGVRVALDIGPLSVLTEPYGDMREEETEEIFDPARPTPVPDYNGG